MNRNLTVRSQVDCEMLGLSLADIGIMKNEFNDEFLELLKDSDQQLIICIKKGMEAAKACISEYEES